MNTTNEVERKPFRQMDDFHLLELMEEVQKHFGRDAFLTIEDPKAPSHVYDENGLTGETRRMIFINIHTPSLDYVEARRRQLKFSEEYWQGRGSIENWGCHISMGVAPRSSEPVYPVKVDNDEDRI